MRALSIILMTTALFACNSNTKVKTDNSTNVKKITTTIDCNVALKFINDYTKFCALKTSSTTETNWIERNPLLTDNFKLTYKRLLDSAQKKDPELGLDSNPIWDAQDFPDKGFELTNCDNKAGYVTVEGKDWKDFILVLRVVLQNGKWLVDGCGVINIPVDKRAKR